MRKSRPRRWLMALSFGCGVQVAQGSSNNLDRLKSFKPRVVGKQTQEKVAPEISGSHRMLLQIVLDQSQSMEGDYRADNRTESKIDATTRYTNDLLNTLILRSTDSSKQPAVIKGRFDISLIGYSEGVRHLLQGKEITPIENLQAISIHKIIDQEADEEESEAIFVQPQTYGGTPMDDGMRAALEVLEPWARQHPESHPPLLVHLSDGANNRDSDPAVTMRRIAGVTTNHGNSIIFNAHIEDSDKEAVLFPKRLDDLMDKSSYAKMLFETSSKLPPWWLGEFKRQGYAVDEDSRAMIFNGSPKVIFDAINIGTRVSMGGAQ